MDWDVDYNVDVAVDEEKAVPFIASQFNTTRHSTGSVILDALFKGGLPEGKIVELESLPVIGRAIALQHCITYCASGKKVVYIDLDQKVDCNLLERTGLDKFHKDGPDKSFFLWQATSIEDCEKIMDTILKDGSKSPAVVIIDSPSMLNLIKGFIKSATQLSYSFYWATILKNFLLRYRVKFRQISCSMILINHLKKVNTVTSFESLIYDPFTDAHIVISNVSTLLDNIQVSYDDKLSIYAVKNHFGHSSISLPAYMIYGEGLSNTMSYRDYLIQHKIITYFEGCYTFKTPDCDFVCSGEVEIDRMINEYFAYVQQIVAETGGFILKNE